ncbi:hypothetical protein V6N12_015136 [Hibiscus sabdariffa]|uniref:Uncharacterized protein n=1 Tax=Hibiscus sabdariffa TaxID=183260 RepID=A0ABR2DNH5_9ROSI
MLPTVTDIRNGGSNPLVSFLAYQSLKPLNPSLSLTSPRGAGSKSELLLRLPIPVGLAPMASLGSASALTSSRPNLGSRLRRKLGLIWMRPMAELFPEFVSWNQWDRWKDLKNWGVKRMTALIAREMVISPQNARLGLTQLTKRVGLLDRPDNPDGELIKYRGDGPHVIPANMTPEVSELFTRELTRDQYETPLEPNHLIT